MTEHIHPVIALGLGDIGLNVTSKIKQCLKNDIQSPILDVSTFLNIDSSGTLIDRENQLRKELFTNLDQNQTPQAFVSNQNIFRSSREAIRTLDNYINQQITVNAFNEKTKLAIQDSGNNIDVEDKVDWVIFTTTFDPIGSTMLFPILNLYSENRSNELSRVGELHVYLLCPELFQNELFGDDQDKLSVAYARSYAFFAELEYLLTAEGSFGTFWNMPKLTSNGYSFRVISNRSKKFSVESVDKLIKPLSMVLHCIHNSRFSPDRSAQHDFAKQFNTIGYSEINLEKDVTYDQLNARFIDQYLSELFSHTNSDNQRNRITIEASHVTSNLYNTHWQKLFSLTSTGSSLFSEYQLMISKSCRDYGTIELFYEHLDEELSNSLNRLETCWYQQNLYKTKLVDDFSEFFVKQYSHLMTNEQVLFANNHDSYFKDIIFNENGKENLTQLKEDIYGYHDDWFDQTGLRKSIESAYKKIDTLKEQLQVINQQLIRMSTNQSHSNADVSKNVLIEKRKMIETTLKSEQETLNSFLEYKAEIDVQVDSKKTLRTLYDERIGKEHDEIESSKKEVNQSFAKAQTSNHILEEKKDKYQHQKKIFFYYIPLILILCLIAVSIITPISDLSLKTKIIITGLSIIGYIVLIYLFLMKDIINDVSNAKRIYNSDLKTLLTDEKSLIKHYINISMLELDYVKWSTALTWIQELHTLITSKGKTTELFYKNLSDIHESAKKAIQNEADDNYYPDDTMVYECVPSKIETQYLLKTYPNALSHALQAFKRNVNLAQIFNQFKENNNGLFLDNVSQYVKEAFYEFDQMSIEDYLLSLNETHFQQYWYEKLRMRITEPEMFLILNKYGVFDQTRTIHYLGFDRDKGSSLLHRIKDNSLVNSLWFKRYSSESMIIISELTRFSAGQIENLRKYFKYYKLFNIEETVHAFELKEPLPSLMVEEKLTRDSNAHDKYVAFFLLCRFLKLIIAEVFVQESESSNDSDLWLCCYRVHLPGGQVYNLGSIDVTNIQEKIKSIDERTKSLLADQIYNQIAKYNKLNSDTLLEKQLLEEPKFNLHERRIVFEFIKELNNKQSNNLLENSFSSIIDDFLF